MPMKRLITLLLCSSAIVSQAAVVKTVLRAEEGGRNLLKADAWRPYEEGLVREGDLFVCANGANATARRGVTQTVVLNQSEPHPIVARAWSRAEDVGGSANGDYSLYLDLIYADGTPLWGQIASFGVGSHDWQSNEVVVLPEKAVKHVSFYMLLRRHSGKASFRDPVLYEVRPKDGAAMFDGQPVLPRGKSREGFLVRDVAAGSDWMSLDAEGALGIELHASPRSASAGYSSPLLPEAGFPGTSTGTDDGATIVDVTLRDTTGKDRAVTLAYTLPVEGDGWRWLAGPRRHEETRVPREYSVTTRVGGGGNARLSRWPFAAVARGNEGWAIGIDMDKPAFYRVGYASGTRELFVTYDLGLTKERPSAEVRLCLFPFDPAWGFRSALKEYHALFPDHFRCRTRKQGIWMPFAKVSAVEKWQDFGFRFKEGTNETAWDDAHDMLTFRYTEPQTWWMPMAKGTPRTMAAALAQVKALAAKGDKRALAFATSAYHDEQGHPVGQFHDTPWCDGVVWSMNTAPGIRGDVTHFKNCWNHTVVSNLYGADRKADQDGEYVDSSEGYVTTAFDFRREHFAAMQTPLTFSRGSHSPAIFRGLVVYEYVRRQAEDVHGMGKLMMANGTPGRLCWLAPWLDVMGTETDWNRGGVWRPLSDEEMLYRRSMCGKKPYCFLMNTVFDEFPYTLVEKYMKRCLAYGMFPGFFSHNASEGHYFSRPALYNRDRSLFKKYVPLCKRVAEAGWEPITLARSSDPKVFVERFGSRYLTVFNDSMERRTATLTLDGIGAATARELIGDQALRWKDGTLQVTLNAEDVAVIEMARDD
jgi:hypothetical protein